MTHNDRAIAAGRKAVELSQGAPTFVALLGDEYAVAGRLPEARSSLEQLHKLSKQQYVPSYVLARIHAVIGETDEALRWLETAYQERAAWMVLLKIDLRFDYLRSDPRFQDLMRDEFPAVARRSVLGAGLGATKTKEWLSISCKRHQIGHLDF